MSALELEVERLEQRRLLAGNVEVRIAGNDLIIEGDDQNNHIAIVQVDTPVGAVIRVEGAIVAGGGTTTINGTTGQSFGLASEIDDVRINFRDQSFGNSADVSLTDTTGDLLFRAESEYNRIYIIDSEFDPVRIRSRGLLESSMINNSPSFSPAMGDVRINMGREGGNAYFYGVWIDDDLRVIGGIGNDGIGFDYSRAEDVIITTRRGDDVLGLGGATVAAIDSLRVSMGAGNDRVMYRSDAVLPQIRSRHILGSGDDYISVAAGVAKGDTVEFDIVAGAGDDHVFFQNASTDGGGNDGRLVARVLTQSGDDTVRVYQDPGTIYDVTGFLGSGDDEMRFSGGAVSVRLVTAFGGSGFDLYRCLGLGYPNERISGFEDIRPCRL